MIEIVWEFLVKEGAQGQFELLYGPGGAWSKVSSNASGFRGTTLLRDEENPQRYLTIEVWDSTEQHEQMLLENRSKVSELDEAFTEWTISHNKLGTFRTLTEASVRARRRTSRKR